MLSTAKNLKLDEKCPYCFRIGEKQIHLSPKSDKISFDSITNKKKSPIIS